MSDDFTQLDELIESDVLDALGLDNSAEIINDANGEVTDIPEELAEMIAIDESEGEIIDDLGDIEILPMAEIESALEEQEEFDELPSASSSDLAMLLGKLLNNKTIEITIKIRD